MSQSPSPLNLPTLGQLAAVAAGSLYVTGFYVNSIFMTNHGILRTELFRLDYIKIGFSFVIITLGIVFIPAGILLLSYNVRRASQLRHFWLGIIGNSLNGSMFFGVPLFMAFFITSREWRMPLSEPVLFMRTVEGASVTLLCLAAFGIIFVPALERMIKRLKLLWFFVEILRYGVFLLCLTLLVVIGAEIPWLSSLARNGSYYLLSAIVFVLGILASFLWNRNIQKISGASLIYPLVGFGLVLLYYFSVTSFVFGVYKFIPQNRGGGLPVAELYIRAKNVEALPPERRLYDSEFYGPFYLIEETNEFLFVAHEGMDEWTVDYVDVDAIYKAEIIRIRISRIEDGFPRFLRSR